MTPGSSSSSSSSPSLLSQSVVVARGGWLAARPGFVALARFGLVIKGVVQLLVGLLAMAALLGEKGGRITDGVGAMKALAGHPLGRPVLLLLTIGLFAYAGLRLVQGLLDPMRRPRSLTTAFFRAGDVLSGLGYVLLGIGAGRLFVGLGATSGDARAKRLTAETLAMPYGPKMLLAFAVVLGLLTVLFLARAFVVRDVCGDLLTEKMGPARCRASALLIRFASLVQATLFGTMATLFYRVAVLGNPAEARGMGGVMRFIGARLGPVIMALVAIGFVAMAATSFIESRWRKDLEIRGG